MLFTSTPARSMTDPTLAHDLTRRSRGARSRPTPKQSRCVSSLSPFWTHPPSKMLTCAPTGSRCTRTRRWSSLCWSLRRGQSRIGRRRAQKVLRHRDSGLSHDPIYSNWVCDRSKKGRRALCSAASARRSFPPRARSMGLGWPCKLLPTTKSFLPQDLEPTPGVVQ